MNIILKFFCVVLFCMSFCHVHMAEAISLNVVNGDVRDVLRSVARMNGINIILDDSVTGNVTVNLQEVSSEQAIRNIALARGLSMTVEDGTVIVSSKAALDNGFSSVHVMPLKYANPDDVMMAMQLMTEHGNTDAVTKSKKAADTVKESVVDKKDSSEKQLKSSQEQKTTKSLRFWTDPGTNSLLVYGTAQQAKTAEQLLKKLDVPAKQVSLEAKIVSLEKSAAKNLGVGWTWNDIGMKHVSDFELTAKVDALINNGKAEVLSRPNITTMQGREAVINIGGEVPIPSTSVTNSTTTTSLEYRQTGIILRCTPYVNEQGHITAKVHTEVSTPQYVEEMNAYKFQKRSADTMVRLVDGDMMVIGGLIGNEERKELRKVPFLSDIPVIGSFFKSHSNSKVESEVIIFLTAKLLD